LGSVERFFATLLEYHSGNLPLWLAPVQIMLIPITDAQLNYARKIEEQLLEQGFRCELDSRSEKMGYKIRSAEKNKIPFMCILGKNEENNNQVTLRQHTVGDLGAMNLEAAIAILRKEL